MRDGRMSRDSMYDETAEERLRRRIERDEARRRRRITGFIIAGVIAVLVVAPIAIFALQAGAAPEGEKRDDSRAAEVPRARASGTDATAGAATPTAEPASVPGSRTAAQPETPSKPAQTPEPKPRPKAKPTPTPKPKPKPKPAKVATVQHFSIRIGQVGYEPERITAKAGVPIELTVGKGEGCAAGFAMPQLDILKDNSKGPVTFRLKALERGEYVYTCSMGMVTGTLVVR